jgi:hypothetical protein
MSIIGYKSPPASKKMHPSIPTVSIDAALCSRNEISLLAEAHCVQRFSDFVDKEQSGLPHILCCPT